VRLTRPRLAILTALIVLAVAVPALAAAKSTITMSGSTSVFPLAEALASKYVKTNKNVAFRILQGGSDVGINDVAHGRVSIGDSSRDPLPSDPGGLTFNKIARDGVCIITNPANPISSLTQADVQAIFTGQTRDWSGVPGAKVSGPIDLVSRTASSGTLDAFQNIFLGQNLAVAPSAAQKQSNGLVEQAVRTDQDAIGFVSFAFTAGTNAVAYQGVPCTLRNAKSGQYGGVRNFWMVTRGKATGATGAFIKWVQTSAAAQQIVASDWVPLH